MHKLLIATPEFEHTVTITNTRYSKGRIDAFLKAQLQHAIDLIDKAK